MTGISTDHDPVNADVFGDGPPLVLFHSLLSDRTSFDRIVPELAKRFRVIVPELPGFGRSQAVEGGLPAVADRMASFVRHVAPDQDAIVLGNGYGGFVALQMAIRHPGIAKRLVLADCGAAFSEPAATHSATWRPQHAERASRPSPRLRCADCSRLPIRRPIPT